MKITESIVGAQRESSICIWMEGGVMKMTVPGITDTIWINPSHCLIIDIKGPVLTTPD
jgi:hypothetical protein